LSKDYKGRKLGNELVWIQVTGKIYQEQNKPKNEQRPKDRCHIS